MLPGSCDPCELHIALQSDLSTTVDELWDERPRSAHPAIKNTDTNSNPTLSLFSIESIIQHIARVLTW